MWTKNCKQIANKCRKKCKQIAEKCEQKIAKKCRQKLKQIAEKYKQKADKCKQAVERVNKLMKLNVDLYEAFEQKILFATVCHH